MIALSRGSLPRRAIQAAPFCVGLAVSSGHAIGIAAAVLMPAFALRALSRRSSYASALLYYAGALWPLIPGANNFFGPNVSNLTAFLLWGFAAALLALLWLLLWSGNTRQALWRAPVGLLLTVIPPLGIIGWASPLTAAGILFPGTVWCGLLGCAVLTGALAVWPKSAAIVAVTISVAVNLMHPKDPLPPVGWQAIDTHFGAIAHRAVGPLAEYRASEEIQQQALSAKASVIVFPETVVSYWTASTDEFWQQTLAALKSRGKTILVGARIPRARDAAWPPRRYDFLTDLAMLQGNSTAVPPVPPDELKDESAWAPAYFNGIVIRGAQATIFRQRIPVPIGMWNPFRRDSAPLNLFGRGVVTIGKERAAILVCYEQLISWPILSSMFQHPSVVVGVANDYWASSTTIPQFQRGALTSWARLFGIPCLLAVNT
jgi:hypothetical protein